MPSVARRSSWSWNQTWWQESVAEAVRICWASAYSARADDYRDRTSGEAAGTSAGVIAHRATRLDRDRVGTGLTLHVVPEGERELPALDDSQLRDLVALGHRIAALLGQPQDIELVIAAGTIWILRARPITVLDS